MPRPRELPSRARVVIVGGGVGGASIACHLAELGERDVVLLDRNELTSGSTFHSAGLVGQLRSTVSLTRMMMHSVALYRELGDACGWTEVGSLRLASSHERMEELRRQAAWAKTFGLPLELISAAEAQERFPLMSTDGVLGAVFLPTDGYLDPSQLTYALAERARAGGHRIFTHTRVTGIDVERGRVRGVQTEWGAIECEVLVNAGGMFAAEIGRMAGVRVPIVPMAHEYLVTQPFRESDPGHPPARLPTLRDPDLLIYFREEGAGLVMGGYERACAPWALDERLVDRIPPDFNGRLLEEDWDRFEEIVRNSRVRVPAMEDVKVTRLINGPEAFTPDGEFCLGETEVRGLFVAAGFCAHGLAGAGGIGKVMAEWIHAGEPSLDLWHMDIRRFGAHYRSPSYTLKRTREVYETYYDIRHPGHERRAGRPLRVSSAYEWHRAHGAAFGEKSGWERVNWYESNANLAPPTQDGLRPRGWAGHHWSPAIGAEHAATRERAGLFDESSFSKLEVAGPGAGHFLESLCDNRVAREVGQITYTQMLNGRGGIECDFTVTRVEQELFQIVTGTAFGNHDLSWIRRHAPHDGSVRVSDVTARWACFALWGPLAREILAPLTPDPLDFGYMRMRDVAVGDVPVRALRVTFVGEMGWELYCPAEYGASLWRTLWEAGSPLGMVAGGYRAIDSMRLEKGYRVWAADITPDDTPLEAGLGFCARRDKDYLGRAALEAREPEKLLRCLTLADPRAVALGNEPVRVDGEVVGRVTSGGYGYTVERSIAYAYLPPDRAEAGTSVEVDVFGEWVAGEVATEPLYDPDGTRLRG
jgi:glycine cleavage system aminomethyltransferase T/glycine/D-amino acid oxidase-like deaminating enzyme